MDVEENVPADLSISTESTAMVLPEGKLIQRTSSVVMRKIAGETLLIPINQTGVELQKVYALNETASVIWSGLETSRTVDELVTLVNTEYEGPADQIRNEVLLLLEELLAKDFITTEQQTA